MEKYIRLLAILLGVQVLLAAAVWVSGSDLSAKPDNTPLLALKGKTVDRVTIDGPDKAKVTIAKTGNAWHLPEHDDFPANGDKIEQLLTRLKALKHGTPIADTKGALERFKVSDRTFKRRITLAQGTDTLATLYLGSAQGRETHAREASENAVHLVKLGTYDAPTKVEDWEDKTVLQIPKDDIVAIEVHGLRFERTSNAKPKDSSKQDKNKTAEPAVPDWQVAGHIEGTLKPDAADKFATKLAQLRIGSVLGKQEQPDYGLKTPALTLSVTRKNGQELGYRLAEMTDKKEQYVLKVSSRAEYFRLPGYTAEPLIKAAKYDALVDHGGGAKPPVPVAKK